MVYGMLMFLYVLYCRQKCFGLQLKLGRNCRMGTCLKKKLYRRKQDGPKSTIDLTQVDSSNPVNVVK